MVKCYIWTKHVYLKTMKIPNDTKKLILCLYNGRILKYILKELHNMLKLVQFYSIPKLRNLRDDTMAKEQ